MVKKLVLFNFLIFSSSNILAASSFSYSNFFKYNQKVVKKGKSIIQHCMKHSTMKKNYCFLEILKKTGDSYFVISKSSNTKIKKQTKGVKPDISFIIISDKKYRSIRPNVIYSYTKDTVYSQYLR